MIEFQRGKNMTIKRDDKKVEAGTVLTSKGFSFTNDQRIELQQQPFTYTIGVVKFYFDSINIIEK